MRRSTQGLLQMPKTVCLFKTHLYSTMYCKRVRNEHQIHTS